MGIEPENSARPGRGEPAERADRDRVVAAENQRDEAFLTNSLDLGRDPRAGVQDLVQEARLLGAARPGLREGRLDVASILDVDPGAGELSVQAGIANRRWAHVDAAAPCAEIESGSHDRHAYRRHGHTLFADAGLGLHVRVDLVGLAPSFFGVDAFLFGPLCLFLRKGGPLIGV